MTCSPEDEVDDVWLLMQEKAITGLPVTLNGKLVGILTQEDLLESGFAMPTFESDKGRYRSLTKVANIMKTQVIVVRPEVKAISVAKVMVFKDIGRVPVVDRDRKLLGIVDREDIAKIVIGK
ncbi:MAG: CBS domain-containing protein [Candidatus Bathyarchaeia archaeon]